MRYGTPYWYSWWRRALIRIALGKRTFEYMLKTLSADKRIHGARMVDIIVRQDGIERRIEADWVKTIKRICIYRPRPKLLPKLPAASGSKQDQSERAA